MSIIAYAGLPGHGKSYSAVANVIIPALKKDRTVYHNLHLNEPELMAISEGRGELVPIGEGWTAAELVENKPPGAVCVFDETWQWWPAGIKTAEVPRDQLALFKEHRHSVGPDGFTSEILIIDQELGSGVAKFLRDLVEQTFIHEKLTDVGATNRFRVDVYRRAVDATKPTKSRFIRSMHGKYDPAIFKCYISHTHKKEKDFGQGGLEQIADKRGTVWGSYSVRLAIGAVVLLPILGWFAINSFYGIADAGAQSERSEDATPRPVQPAPRPRTVFKQPTIEPEQPTKIAPPEPQPSKPVQKGPRTSNVWRVKGVIWREDGTGRALLASAVGTRFVPAQDCKQDEGGNWSCPVDGQVATQWSGSNMGSIYSGEVAPGVIDNHGLENARPDR